MSIPCKMRPAGGRILPVGYKKLEYIKVKQKSAFWTNYCPSYHSSCEMVLNVEEAGAYAIIFGNNSINIANNFTVALEDIQNAETRVAFDFNKIRTDGIFYKKTDWWGKKFNCFTDNTGVSFNGTLMCNAPATSDFKSSDPWAIATARYGAENGFIGRIYKVIFRENRELKALFIPAVDIVGAPCLFDLVGRIPYYNMGSEDVEVPYQSSRATTMYSLRRPITYAQLTEYGVRRLYHVPNGYNGTKEEYAADNGFKPLVETEKPEGDYWNPHWKETDEEIVLEWIKTESSEDIPATEV